MDDREKPEHNYTPTVETVRAKHARQDGALYADDEISVLLGAIDARLAAAERENAALRAALEFSPPLGPPDLPKPWRCPLGHAVTWITNRLAICLDSNDSSCIWSLIPPRSSPAPFTLTTILNPEARGFAYAIKRALALTPTPAAARERGEQGAEPRGCPTPGACSALTERSPAP